MELNKPRKAIIKLNPGSVPQAGELASLTRGLAQVRSQIVRETMGAVSPRQQLKAVDLIMQKHHDAIAALISAGKRNGSILAPVDGLQLIVSVIEHAAMAQYWLQLARHLRKLPSSDQHDQSPQKSRQHRMRVLEKIKSNCQLVVDLMNELWDITPPNGRRLVDQLLETFDLQILCVQILATISATYSASGGPPLTRSELDDMLTELDQVRLLPSFRSRSTADRDLLWTAVSCVHEALGNRPEAKAALAERRLLLVGSEADSRLLLLVDLIGYSESAEERLAFINELKSLAGGANIGSIFSRARLGRISIFRDSYWYVAAQADTSEPIGKALFDDCFASYEEWLYGRSAPWEQGTVRLSTTWQGKGVIAWKSGEEVEKRPLTSEPELAARLLLVTEGRGHAAERKALRDITAYLTDTFAPVLKEALDAPGERRLHATGQVGMLPILVTHMAGKALGSSAEVAFRHPNADARFRSQGITDHVELTVIDKCFNEDARTVGTAARFAASKQHAQCDILDFNSETGALPVDELVNALRSVASAVLFCHAVSPIAIAGSAGLVLGPSDILTVDILASLNLDSLEELALIGCASGRSNPFLGEVTLAHAAALAGAGEILYTLWPIRPSVGSRFLTGMFEARANGQTMREYLARQYREDSLGAAPFAIMRP